MPNNIEISAGEPLDEDEIPLARLVKKRKLSNGKASSSQPTRGKGKARGGSNTAGRGKAKRKVETRAMRKRRREDTSVTDCLEELSDGDENMEEFRGHDEHGGEVRWTPL